MVQVKICGLRSRGDLAATAEAGATFAGLVFFPLSPRNVSLADARWIVTDRPETVRIVALTVDADDALLDSIVSAVEPDMLQLHGGESPDRTAEIRARYGISVMKAVGIAGPDDLAALEVYSQVADQILVDARPPKGGFLPGGNGLAFDWQLLEAYPWQVPWMLAGGLTPDNVAEAVRLTGALQVDTSTGVEASRGNKDHALIARFVRAAQGHVAVGA